MAAFMPRYLLQTGPNSSTPISVSEGNGGTSHASPSSGGKSHASPASTHKLSDNEEQELTRLLANSENMSIDHRRRLNALLLKKIGGKGGGKKAKKKRWKLPDSDQLTISLRHATAEFCSQMGTVVANTHAKYLEKKLKADNQLCIKKMETIQRFVVERYGSEEENNVNDHTDSKKAWAIVRRLHKRVYDDAEPIAKYNNDTALAHHVKLVLKKYEDRKKFVDDGHFHGLLSILKTYYQARSAALMKTNNVEREAALHAALQTKRAEMTKLRQTNQLPARPRRQQPHANMISNTGLKHLAFEPSKYSLHQDDTYDDDY